MLKYYIFLLSIIGFCDNGTVSAQQDHPITPGAERLEVYLPALEEQRVGLVVNHTSKVGEEHLVDRLIAEGVDVAAIFAPEHGFSGDADAGENITDGRYLGRIPIYSIYGKTKKPSPEMLEGLDVLIFDIQDVGARFFTYISTMHYVMEAAAEQGVKMMVLDRPNPNAHYVDGPVMIDELKSFVGKHSVPTIYGMTIGEYAQMINGEGWLTNGVKCDLTVVPCAHYDHSMRYDTPIPPSPNLPNPLSTVMYPSLCLFEGTQLSAGRGTDRQFQIVGHPEWRAQSYEFTPVSGPGSKYPKHQDKLCYGRSFIDMDVDAVREQGRMDMSILLDAYSDFVEAGVDFFIENNFFDKLAGNYELRKQIKAGMTEDQIRATWQDDLDAFKLVRAKYLIYED